jgi:hypothetical protein
VNGYTLGQHRSERTNNDLLSQKLMNADVYVWSDLPTGIVFMFAKSFICSRNLFQELDLRRLQFRCSPQKKF